MSNKYYTPIHIDFFKSNSDYSTRLLTGIDSSQKLTILLYLLSQFYYRNKDSKSTPINQLKIDKHFCKQSCFLHKLKQANQTTIKTIQSLEQNDFIEKVMVSAEHIQITFNVAFLCIKEKTQRFSLCLDDLLTFKYLEHSLVYILTRYGKNQSFLYHNYLCKMLGMTQLELNRQRAKIKRIFSLLVKKKYLSSYQYIKGQYQYCFER